MTHTERNSLDKVEGAVAGNELVGHSSSRGRHTGHKGGRAEVVHVHDIWAVGNREDKKISRSKKGKRARTLLGEI